MKLNNADLSTRFINPVLCEKYTRGDPRIDGMQVAGWDMTLRETQSELFSLADDVQKLVLGQQVRAGGGAY